MSGSGLPPDLFGLGGRTVIVAGAGGGGMGTLLTRLLAEVGATVIGVDRSGENLERDLGPLIASGLPITPVQADLNDDEGIARIMACASNLDAPLHGLVTVVGGVPDRYWGPATEVTRQDWHELFAYNLDSMFFLSQAVAKRLRELRRPGALVAIASISGLTATPFHIGYGAAKAAVISAAKTMAIELAAEGIRVNCIAPGPVATPTAAMEADPERDRWAVPMGRQGTAHEIAASALYLLSDMAGYVTGQCLAVDGGISAKWSHLDIDNCPAYARDRSFLEQWQRDPAAGSR